MSKTVASKLTINLTAKAYEFREALFINRDVIFTSKQKTQIKISYSNPSFLLQVKAGNTLGFKNINVDLSALADFITSDTSGSSSHSNFEIRNSHFFNLNGTFFRAALSSVADSINVYNCTFYSMKGRIFDFTNETTHKGLYNVEK